VEILLRSKAKLDFSAMRIETSPRLAVRHALVPYNPADETTECGDELNQITGGDLESRSDIDPRRRIVTLRRHHDRTGTILDVQKLTCRSPVTPAHYLSVPVVNGIEALTYDRGYDVTRVGLEVVSWPIQIYR